MQKKINLDYIRNFFVNIDQIKKPVPFVEIKPRIKSETENKIGIIFLNGLNGTKTMINYFNYPVFEDKWLFTFDNRAQGENQNFASKNYRKYVKDAYLSIEYLIKENKQIETWYLLGESWGGAIIIHLVKKKLNKKIKGVFFWNMPCKIVNVDPRSKKAAFINNIKVITTFLFGIQLKTDNPPVPDIPADQLFNPEGGLIANTKLQTSAYKNLISSLNLLNDKTYLPNLNNKILMETLQKRPEFKGLSLNIEAGSETLNGTLNLQLKSQTKQQIIEPTTIKITGFQTYSLTNNDPLQYHSFQVDSKRWFDEKLPISTTTNLTNAIQQISNNQWNQVLEDFRVVSANNASQNFGNAKELKANGFNFEIKSVYDNATSQIKLTITTKFTHKKYQNKNWVPTNQVSVWNQASNTNSVIELFTKENLQQFIVDQTKINEDELATKTPSYYLGKAYYYKSINTEFNNDQDLFENSYLTNNDFTEFYFDQNTNLSLSFSQDSISANDWNNTLSFSVGLVVNDKIVNQSQPFEFNNKNKAISTILKDKLETNRSQIQPSSNLKKRVIQHLKQNHKDDVDQLFANGAQQESKTFDDFPGSSISSQLTQSLLKDNYEQTNNVWEKVKEEIDVALFKEPGINLTDGSFEYQNNHTLNFPSRLFWLSRDDVFVIEQIKYQFSQPNVSIKLTKQGNFISVDLQGETVIDFASDEEKTVPTNFFFNLLTTDWPKN